ncbi:MAG: hypothetical protein HGA39_06500 [Coriobacteriia bacterium]|nr:hypothetical protein [Coriobacteriia bacterium]
MIERANLPEGFVDQAVFGFVQTHVTSLLAWDVIMFFVTNQDVVLDDATLSFVLRRHPAEIRAEVEALCDARILLPCDGGVRYSPEPDLHEQIEHFAESCRDREQRLVLVSSVLQRTAE